MLRIPVRVRTGLLCAVLGVCAVLPALTIGVDRAAAADDGAGPARTDWPEFRGPWGNGHAGAPRETNSTGLPIHWGETENITWKTPIPHQGWSTPVVLGGQVWLTTATGDGHEFYAVCVDAETGRILFNINVFHADDPEPLGNNVNCYASPSPAIEPGRVYVHFGTYGTACLDTATGKTLWERRDLACRHYRGPGSSPILFEDLLVLSFDGVDVQYIAALDTRTGRTVWKTGRSTVWNDLDEQGHPIREGDRRKAFCTPLIVDDGGTPWMFSLGSSAAFAYDPRTGRELWKVPLVGHSSSSRPVIGNGRAFLSTGYGTTELWALRVDGRDGAAGSRVAWKSDSRDAPQTPSLLLVDGLLYMVSNSGAASCFEAATGKRVWRERIGGSYMASPIYAGGRLYFCNLQGKTTVLRAGPVFEVLAENVLEDGFMASPAVSGNALFLRSKTHLYRIESERPGGR